MEELEVSFPARAPAERHDLEPFDRLIDLARLHAAGSASSIPDLIERKADRDTDLVDSFEDRVVTRFEFKREIIFILRAYSHFAA